MIRPARQSDLAEVVSVHQEAFRGFLMTDLGPRFLRAYYQLVLDYPNSLFFVHESPYGATDGFVAGFIDPPRFYRLLKARKVALACAIGLHLLFRPTKWARVLASYRHAHDLSSISGDTTHTAELASLGVSPSTQGKGVGKQLVHAFLQHSREANVERVVLTTDAENNDAVNQFYLRLGFELKKQYWHSPTRRMNLYEIVLIGTETVSPTVIQGEQP